MRSILPLLFLVLVGCDGTIECESNCTTQFTCGTGGSSYDRCVERCKEGIADYARISAACADWQRQMKGCVGGLGCEDMLDWFNDVETAPCQEYKGENRAPECDLWEYQLANGFFDDDDDR